MGWRLLGLLVVVAALAAPFVRLASVERARPIALQLFGEDQLPAGARNGWRVRVVDARSGLPCPGATVQVSLEEGGQPVASADAVTDANGECAARLAVPEREDAPFELVATARSAGASDRVAQRVTVRRRRSLLLTTDKPFYQPGQTVNLRALALARPTRRPLAGEKLVFEIVDPRGNKIFRESATVSEFGVASARCPLAAVVNEGEYAVVATVGSETTRRMVAVKPYALPKFKVELATERTFYRPGETVSARVDARYFFGRPVAGRVAVELAATGTVAPAARGEATLDPGGAARVALPVPDALPAGVDRATLRLSATVTDTAGNVHETYRTFTICRAALVVEALAESHRLAPSVENVVYVAVTHPDGAPVGGAAICLSGAASRFPPEYYPALQKGPFPLLGRARTDGAGLAEIRITPTSSYVEGVVEVETAAGVRESHPIVLGRRTPPWSWEDNLEVDLLLRTDDGFYRTGQTVAVTALSGQPGRVHLDVVREGQTLASHTLELAGGRAHLALPLAADHGGTLRLHAYRVGPDGRFVRASRAIVVGEAQALSVTARAGRPVHEPGAAARVDIEVKGPDGRPVQAALGIDIVDESVFALADFMPGLERTYFAIDASLARPAGSPVAGDRLAAEAQRRWTGTPAEGRDALSRIGRVLLSRFDTEILGMRGQDGLAVHVSTISERMSECRRAAGRAAEGLTELAALGTLPLALLLLVLWLGLRGATGAHRLERGSKQAELWARLSARVIALAFASLFAVGLLLEPALAPAAPLVVLVPLLALLDRWTAADTRAHLPGGLAFHSGVLLVFAVGVQCSAVSVAIGLVAPGTAGAGALIPWLLVLALLSVPAYRVQVARPAPHEARDDEGGDWTGCVLVAVLVALVAVAALNATGTSVNGLIQKVASSLCTVSGGGGVPVSTSAAPAGAPVRVRSYFPETMFSGAVLTDAEGRARLDLTMPDSITTWRLTGLASTRDGALGSVTAPLRVFQDFFVDWSLPPTLTRGDEVDVPVTVYSYLDRPQQVRLELEPADWYELVGRNARTLSLASGQVAGEAFRIRVRRAGDHTLTLRGIGTGASDALRRPVAVVPPGRLVTRAASAVLERSATLAMEVPAVSQDGAERLLLRLYPGGSCQVMEGMDALLREPHGCFEQTTSAAWPNVMVLQYLNRTGRASPAVRARADRLVREGYQRLLTFEAPGGGFSLFAGQEPSLLLSAYGLMEFAAMAEVIPVDPALLERTRAWVLARRGADGSFAGSDARALPGGGFALSAFVVWALARADAPPTALAPSLEWLVREAPSRSDPYELALALNALAATPGTRAVAEVLARRVVAQREAVAPRRGSGASATLVLSYGSAAQVETVALGALGLMALGIEPAVTRDLLAELFRDKQPNGIWYTTTATVFSLMALLADPGVAPGPFSGVVRVTVDGRPAATIPVSHETYDVMQQVDLAPFTHFGAHRVELTAELSGPRRFGVQLVGRWYEPWPQRAAPSAAPQLANGMLVATRTFDRTRLAVGDTLTARVDLVSHADPTGSQVVLDTGVPPGFTVDRESLDELVRRGVGTHHELAGDRLILYLPALARGVPATIAYRLSARTPVRAQTPPATAYDYYNPERRAELAPVELEVR